MAKAKAKGKSFAKLRCESCKNINYFTRKSHMNQRKEGDQKLEMSKFCAVCREHNKHKEARK